MYHDQGKFKMPSVFYWTFYKTAEFERLYGYFLQFLLPKSPNLHYLRPQRIFGYAFLFSHKVCRFYLFIPLLYLYISIIFSHEM